jgi:N-acetylglutamate synthase-like GNAT family acetyltransferase
VHLLPPRLNPFIPWAQSASITMRIEHSKQNRAHRYECWDDYGCSIMASAVVLEWDDHIYLEDINVGSVYRGRGVGTGLLNRILADFKDRPVTANVFEARVPWYRRHGFEPVGKTNDLIKIVRPS